MNLNDIVYCGEFGTIISHSKAARGEEIVKMLDVGSGKTFLFRILNPVNWSAVNADVKVNLLRGILITNGVRALGQKIELQ